MSVVVFSAVVAALCIYCQQTLGVFLERTGRGGGLHGRPDVKQPLDKLAACCGELCSVCLPCAGTPKRAALSIHWYRSVGSFGGIAALCMD